MTGRYSATIDWDLWSYSHGRIAEFSTLTERERRDLGKRFIFTTVPRVARGNMLAERLHSVGYDTSAVPFAGSNEFFRADLVFARGFNHFVDLTERTWEPPTSDRVVDISLKQLRTAKAPWFHWVHLYDPHEAKRSEKRYDKYVRAVDDALERVFVDLEQRDQLSRTALFLLADHGEAFGEHRHQGHGTSLYDEQTLVPFVLCLPGGKGQRFDEPVAAIDATATLAAMTGAPTRDLDGVNVLPLIQGKAKLPTRPIFMELHRYMSSEGAPTTDLKGVVFEGHKLILDRRKVTEEFYDLSRDPKEARNLSGEESAKQTLLREILTSFLASAEPVHPLPDLTHQGPSH
jgi:arylsulfatase A-like enzyme